MPQAVTHVLIPLILADIYRDYFAKKKFVLHYVLIAGIAGLLPDIDVIAYWILNIFFGISINEVHRTFSHTIFIPILLIVLGLLFLRKNLNFLTKHKLNLSNVLFAISFGIIMHLILDSLLSGIVRPFYPLSSYAIGYGLLSSKLAGTLVPGIDAILLVLWLIHEEIKHKISDFI